jgi:CheY-like chemotaxis protein
VLHIVRFVVAGNLLLPSILLLLGVSLLALVVAVVRRWAGRKPIPSLRDKHVLLVEVNSRHRAQLRALLEREGCDVLESADVTEAFGMMHRSPHPLVVVLDIRRVKLLNHVIPDLRMAEHHAYVVLCPWRHPGLRLPGSMQAQLTLCVVRGRGRWRALVRAIALAAGALPSDPLYPASTSA